MNQLVNVNFSTCSAETLGDFFSTGLYAGRDVGFDGLAVKEVLHDGLGVCLFEVGVGKSFGDIHG